ncbi:MAG TPA: hypothetical protein VJG83_06800 [archaeon]|nr:hypothetical protein [archaeon]
MNLQVREMMAKAIFFFIVGVILASLFIWSMMQGILIHVTRPDFAIITDRDTTAFVYYFVGWICGVASLALYWQARNLFHFARISD